MCSPRKHLPARAEHRVSRPDQSPISALRHTQALSACVRPGALGPPRERLPAQGDSRWTPLTVPGIWLLSFFPFWEPPFLSFFFFLAVSLCSFCLFCTSMRTEIKLFFTSFSNSSSSRRANCCTSSSENSLMAASISSSSSFNSDTESLFTPATKSRARQVLRQKAFQESGTMGCFRPKERESYSKQLTVGDLLVILKLLVGRTEQR